MHRLVVLLLAIGVVAAVGPSEVGTAKSPRGAFVASAPMWPYRVAPTRACLALVVVGCGGTGRAHSAARQTRTTLTTEMTSSLSSQVSPCGSLNLPVTWSPSGKQIAWYGYRWPLPPLHHRPASISVLRAICVSDADGKHLRPLRYTVCSEHCTRDLGDGVGQLYWAEPKLLLYGNDSGIFTIPAGRKPKLLTRRGAPEPFVADAAGDRVAVGIIPSCTSCVGPVTVLDVSSGRLVGEVGGKKLANTEPSLSPNGTQVVFARFAKSGLPKGIWTADADGTNLQRLEPSGDNPLWSPAGNRIAYQTRAGTLHLVAPQGGASTTLVRNGPGTVSVFGWSPDGRRIAISDSKRRLAVVNVATGKVRKLLQLHLPYSASSVAWSPDSRQLLVVWRPPAHSGCPSGLWRVPIDGAKPRLVHGC
jgi:WD40 repeat protein